MFTKRPCEGTTSRIFPANTKRLASSLDFKAFAENVQLFWDLIYSDEAACTIWIKIHLQVSALDHSIVLRCLVL